VKYIPLVFLLASCLSPEQAQNVSDVMPEVIDEGLGVAQDVATGNWVGAGVKIVGIATLLGGALWGGKKVMKKKPSATDSDPSTAQ